MNERLDDPLRAIRDAPVPPESAAVRAARRARLIGCVALAFKAVKLRVWVSDERAGRDIS